MAHEESDRLLRPRTTSQAVPIPVVSYPPMTRTSPAPVMSTTPRRRLLKCLLLGGALYASLLLSWSTTQITQLHADDGSGAPSTFRAAVNAVVREAKELQVMQTTTGSMETEQEAKIVTLVSPGREEKPIEEKPADDQKLKAEAEEHARSVKMLPSDEKTKRRLKCIGWRATSNCSPHGPHEPENDKGCYNVVPNSASGYCEVEDQDTGELFRVVKRYCASLRYDAIFRCNETPDFVNYQVESVEVAEKALAPGFALPNVAGATNEPRDGIVMVVYPKLIASAYATIRALRTVLNCRLPIEIWYRQQEIRAGSEALAPLLELADTSHAGEISFHKINDFWATGFGAKVFAIYNSFFERVLFLDADNVPTRDPSYLFDSPEFKDTGAVFWPDFWYPGYTIFNIHGQSLIWEVLDNIRELVRARKWSTSHCSKTARRSAGSR